MLQLSIDESICISIITSLIFILLKHNIKLDSEASIISESYIRTE